MVVEAQAPEILVDSCQQGVSNRDVPKEYHSGVVQEINNKCSPKGLIEVTGL